MSDPRVYFVNDTTTSSNWGCRGTTRALRSLVESTGATIGDTAYLDDLHRSDRLLTRVPGVTDWMARVAGDVTDARRRRALFGAVMDGEWDRRPHEVAPTYGGPPEELFHADRIEDGLLYRALESHFVDGVPWRDTAFVTRAIEHIEAGRSDVWHACSSPEDVLERCAHLEDVYRSLRRDGCLSYRERTPPVEREVGFLRSLEREIIVDVGRDGELLLVSGKHRLSLSRILGLESVPVCFLVRHADWMETRRAVARGTATVRDHPDLRDLPGGTG